MLYKERKVDTIKKVKILYRSPQAISNTKAIQFIKNNLEEVFGNYIMFENCFLADLDAYKKLRADAFLAIDERVFQKAKEYVNDFNKVIKINRSIEQNVLKTISDIPAGTNVLIVNDSYSTAVDTVNCFYEIGISHINMIPFDRKVDHTGIYDHLSLAITPSERHFVPKHIKKIIDIGYRKVSFDTMFKLMKLLDLDISVVNRNLFRYIQTLAEPDAVFHTNYVYGYLKSEMLSKIANSSKNGMLLIDNGRHIVYANDRAAEILKADSIDNVNLERLIGTGALKKPGVMDQPVTINEINYYYDEYPIKLMDEIVGYYITLQEENELLPAKKINQQKGHVAKHYFQNIIHISEEMDKAVHTAEQIALSEHTVLIYGESGTGKELFAQSIHNGSYREKQPFVAVNCAALPENLLESELFGYEPGAFTGANSKGKTGLFEQANHGTIFLDEIGDVSLNLQSRLLRTIQEKQIMKIGSDRIIDVDVRLIAATNKNLRLAVKEGNFRSDLFYRLNVLPIRIPPLRKRKEDIIPLLRHFLKSAFKNLTQEEIELLTSYEWPGNVREVENFCTYYKTLSSFPEYIFEWEHKTEQQLSSTSIQHTIMKIISKNTEISHGIGRSSLAQQLKNSGFHLSDGTLRAMLEQLQNEGLVEIGKGRYGTRITEKGTQALISENEE